MLAFGLNVINLGDVLAHAILVIPDVALFPFCANAEYEKKTKQINERNITLFFIKVKF